MGAVTSSRWVWARSVARSAADHQLSLIGAGVAFFGLLSLAPAMAAVVSVYGLVADPRDVTEQFDRIGANMPADAHRLLGDQLHQVVRSSPTTLGLALIVALVIAVWSGSSAIRQLLIALSAVYGVHESRTFVRLRLRAAILLLGAVAFVVTAVLALTAMPRWIGQRWGSYERLAAAVVRWPLLAVLAMGLLAVIYQVGPDRERPAWRWWSWGALWATGSWLVLSAAFSIYATHFGSYQKTYGALASVVVLSLWLYLTTVIVLVGGEINAKLERTSSQ
jgi:membrane protein